MPKPDKRRLPLFPLTLALVLAMFAQSLETLRASPAKSRVSEFKLANGLQVIVVPDHRAPVVTHYIWYRVGSADEPPGVSGIAHFLEHLMFKSTDRIESGAFSKVISRMGGQDNAFTSHDVTGYYERVAKDRLKTVMAMEADRMVNLKLTEKEVATEREVILEERRSRTENNPSSILSEQMSAALYQNHPYRIPIIGWMHEMAKLSREDALAFYKRFYAPNNAIVVVAGDVTVDEVRALAEATYGALPPNPAIAPRHRAQEPPHRAPRRVDLKDPRAGNASVRRFYLTPSLPNAAPGEAEALYLLMKIAGNGSTSRLYQRLVTEEKVASSAGGWYSGTGLDSGSIALYAVAAPGVGLDKVEASIDRVLHELRENGVTEQELDRAKKSFIADFVYESDSQSALARRYAEGALLGLTIEQVNGWPDAIRKVTVDDVKQAAIRHFDIRRSVTGTLVPLPAEAESDVVAKAAANKS
ncbi:MAG TPA: pitrilysin family protein [Hyphomicrobiaceae bacterium]|nr:pitrilysin family protein [Hyphomicrobiaceae bacterium]